MQATYIYPGQGSQKVGMGKDFYESSKIAKEMFELASDTLNEDMKDLMFEENDKLNETEFSQPAILLVSAIAHQLYSKKIEPIAGLGHSLGEFSALQGAGALSLENALQLVSQRGVLMKKACEGKGAGMMAVIGLDFDTLFALCEGFQKDKKAVYLANINNETQIVLAGKKRDLEAVEETLRQSGAKKTVLLNMSVASHCPLLSPIQKEFEGVLDEYLEDEFLYPIISNVTAKEYKSKSEAKSLLCEQLVSPVLYTKCVQEAKSELFIEFGGSVLKGLNRRITKSPTYAITDMKSLEAVELLCE